jgi:hypothetical protein
MGDIGPDGFVRVCVGNSSRAPKRAAVAQHLSVLGGMRAAVWPQREVEYAGAREGFLRPRPVSARYCPGDPAALVGRQVSGFE